MWTKRLKDRVVAASCLQVDLGKEIAIEAARVGVFVGELWVGVSGSSEQEVICAFVHFPY